MRIIEARRDLRVLQCEHRLDQSGHARRGVEMPHIRFHRADRAETRALRRGAKRLRERAHFDRIADGRSGAVRFDVADAVGLHVGIRQRLDDRIGLAVHTRRGVSGLFRAVVVDRGAFDDRADRVAVGDGIAQPFQHDHAATAAEDCAVCLGIECAHMPVRRTHAAGIGKISRAVRRADRDCARERDVALLAEQALPREMHGDERCGARGLDGEARAFEIEFVRDARAEEILVVENERRDVVFGKIPPEPGVHEVGVHRSPGEDADACASALRVAARVFQRLVREFQQDAVLRVHRPRFIRREAEKCRIKCARFFEDRRGFDVVRRGEMRLRSTGFQDVVVGKLRDGFHASREVAPEFLRVPRTGEAAGESDNGDVQTVVHHRVSPLKNFRVLIFSQAPVPAAHCGPPCRSRSAGFPRCARSDSAPCSRAAAL